MPSSGLSGQYGLIPYSVMRRKFEATLIDEDPYATYDYMRRTISDFRCDPTFMASDEKREDTHAEEILSVRHNGHRSGELPDMPDGEFLELTGRDPRGVSLDPKFSDARAQMESRAEQYAWSDSTDGAVAEREKAPHYLIKQMREAFYGIKDRLKIFDTSFDNIMGTHKGIHPGESRVDASEATGAISSITDMERRNDATTRMSNALPTGWDTVGDARFRVAQYGLSGRAVAAPGPRLHGTSTAATAETGESLQARRALAQTMKHVIVGGRGPTVGERAAYNTPEGFRKTASGAAPQHRSQNASFTGDAKRVELYAETVGRATAGPAAVGNDQSRSLTTTTRVERMGQAVLRGVAVHDLDAHTAISRSDHGPTASMEAAASRPAVGTARGPDAGHATAAWASSMRVAPLSSIARTTPGARNGAAEQFGGSSRQQQASRLATPTRRDTFSTAITPTAPAIDGAEHESYRGSMKKYTREMTDTGVTHNSLAALS